MYQRWTGNPCQPVGSAFGFRSRFFVGLSVLLISSPLLLAQAQRHPHDFRGVDARTFNPGRGSVGSLPGVGIPGYRTTGPVIYGNPGLVQQFGRSGTSRATFTDGRIVAGVVRSQYGAFHLSNGVYVPGYVVPGYGTGNWHPAFGWLPPVTIDPITGQLIPFDPWCAGGGIYFGGFNPWYPGSILGPTILSMNISMQPAITVPSTASYTVTDPLMMVDPRIIDLLAPAKPDPGDRQVPAPPQPHPPQPPQDQPLLEEFGAYSVEKESQLVDRINSLRHQSMGDDAFRKEDYASAAEEYRHAADLAPDRPAVWMRLANSYVALSDYEDAVRCLKTGLALPSDGTRCWITAEELYSSRVAERTRSHAAGLWNWLSERPLSADRLLLAGTFQKQRGFHDVGDSLLAMGAHEGSEAERVRLVTAMAAADPGQRELSQELSKLVQAGRSTAVTDPASVNERDEVPKTEPESDSDFPGDLRIPVGLPNDTD